MRPIERTPQPLALSPSGARETWRICVRYFKFSDISFKIRVSRRTVKLQWKNIVRVPLLVTRSKIKTSENETDPDTKDTTGRNNLLSRRRHVRRNLLNNVYGCVKNKLSDRRVSYDFYTGVSENVCRTVAGPTRFAYHAITIT